MRRMVKASALAVALLVGGYLVAPADAQSTILRGINTISGHILFSPDNTYDIGATGARPRSIYVGTSVLAGANLSAGGSGGVLWSGRSVMSSPSDGVVLLQNNALNDLSRLQRGGTTSSFPADARDGVMLRALLADGTEGGGYRASRFYTGAGGTSDGAVTSAQKIVKSITGIADNTATATVTVTVPNAAHSAVVRVTLMGALGAGGAVGAREATGTISYDIAVARTAGVATVATASTGYGSATSAVAGATTITISAAPSSMTGAVGATQTFTVNVTIARGGGSSDNHTCIVLAELINAAASGVTIS